MENSFILQKAGSQDKDFSAPQLTMTAAVSGLGAFGGLICLCTMLLAAFSGGNVSVKAFCAAGAAAVLFTALFVFVSIMYRKQKKKYLKERKELKKTAVRVRGKIVGVTKYVRHVKYMKDSFDEVLWCFKIEYKDGGTVKTVQSDKYLNDITRVLKSDRVDVLILKDKTLAFKNYQLRQDDSQPFVKLETEIIEQDSEI